MNRSALPTPRAVATAGPARLVAACLAALVAVAVLAVGGPSVGAEAVEPARSVAVQVVDNTYSPPVVTAEVGESVTWSWVGDNPHSVSGGPWGSSHPGCSAASTLACGTRGTTFTWTPQQVGTVDYRCEVHAGMNGTVEVVAAGPDPSPTPTDDESPRPEPSQSATASPSPGASPSPSGSPSARPSPSSSPSPSRSPSASPSPSSTVGPPPARGTEPPVVVEPSPGSSGPATPRPEVTLEAFPEAPDPDDVVASERAREQGPGEPVDRATPLALAIGLVLGTGVALVQFVLLGPAWVTRDPDTDPVPGDDDRDDDA